MTNFLYGKIAHQCEFSGHTTQNLNVFSIQEDYPRVSLFSKKPPLLPKPLVNVF